MSALPIADHALLSDRHSAALVTRDGSVVWLCFPRFDSESVFAAILDDDAGHWSIQPTATATSTREYVDGTMALRTTFHTAEGDLELLDAMDLGDSFDPHRLGEHAPHTLLRGVRCTTGRVTVEMTYRPRPEYGLVVPIFSEIESGFVSTGGSGRLTLSMPGKIDISPFSAPGSANHFRRHTPRVRSRPRWTRRLRAGRAGLRFTKTTTVPGVTWFVTRGGCCKR